MSTPALREGDTIMVRAKVKTFVRQKPEGTEDVPMACVPTLEAIPVAALQLGWDPDYLELREGDSVRIVGKPDRVAEVVAVSPPGIQPTQYWVKDASEWCLRTYSHDQLVRTLREKP